MRRFIDKVRFALTRFFYGRNGFDALSYSLLGVALVLNVINGFVKSIIIYVIIAIIIAALIYFGFFRALSQNLVARRRENAVFLDYIRRVRNFTVLTYRRIAGFRTTVYVKCRTCGAVLRLPRRRGKHTSICPGCGTRVTVRCLF